MEPAPREYHSAAGHDWLLPLYDVFTAAMGIGAAHRRLIDQAQLAPGQRVLDIGCGTGSLAVRLKQLQPGVEVVGLDPDPRALDRARRKAARRGVALQLDRGFADRLPYPDGAFDRVFSALMLHHLERQDRLPALREVRRVLGAGGSLHLLDFDGTHAHSHGLLARLLHPPKHMAESGQEAVLGLLRDSGFTGASAVADQRTLFGRIVYYRAP